VWLLGHTLVRLCDPSRCGLDIARPVCATRPDQRGRFGVGSIRGEHNRRGPLHPIARAAQADKVFFDHSAALGLGNDMPALIRVPRAARGAAIERGEHVGFDGGGDTGFGHGGHPLLIESPYGITPCESMLYRAG
jgi:hypothetical protein